MVTNKSFSGALLLVSILSNQPNCLAQNQAAANTESLAPSAAVYRDKSKESSTATPIAAVQPSINQVEGSTFELSTSAKQLAEQLKILAVMEELQRQNESYLKQPDQSTLIQMLLTRQRLSDLLRHATLEVEEALAGIDGDIALTNMLLSYISAKHDRAVMLNNVATFVGAGTFGLLDSSTSINIKSPTPQIFGLISSSIATGLPLLTLRQPHYKNPRGKVDEPNMLAPIFGRTYYGASYDKIVWSYINSSESPNTPTRRQSLLKHWQAYRGVKNGPVDRYIDTLTGAPEGDSRLILDMLKTRSELLFDVRAVVQHMYKDISELNNACFKLAY